MQSIQKIRSFLCLPLENCEKQTLLGFMQDPGVRWLRADQLHITLHFLGDLSSETVQKLDQALRKAPLEREPLELTFASWGVFPPGSQGRVLWVGVGGEVAKLVRLQTALGDLLSSCGIVVEKRPYSPHITLARASRGGVISREARKALENAAFYGQGWKADRFLLMKSELLPQGPRYNPLGSYELS